MGRPRKENAMKAGDLQPGLVHFIFAADEIYANELRELCKKNKVTIKKVMNRALYNAVRSERKKSNKTI
jgi:CRISPR/Cas system-associated endonuclease Cas3-HD